MEIILKDNIANPKFTHKWINYSKVTIIKQYKSVNKKKSETKHDLTQNMFKLKG